MATIALIGSDGSGKTTIIRKLQENFPMSMKCIYMGLNIESSNYSLPTSRLILKLKLRGIKKKAKQTDNTNLIIQISIIIPSLSYTTTQRINLIINLPTNSI